MNNQGYVPPQQPQRDVWQAPNQNVQYQSFNPYNEPVHNTKPNSMRTALGKSYFDGGLIQLIGWQILGALITIVTLGICFPWAACKIYAWEAKHTVISGQRLSFDGKATQLFGKWILWLLLSVVTLGIYSFWARINLKKWITKHTHFE